MKTRALLTAAFVAVAVAAVGCGGADTAASRSDAATIACTTQTLGAIFTTDCSTATGTDLASCLIGTPPVCATTKPGCSCTGEGTNLYAAAAAVGLCGGNVAQTRAGLQSDLCGADVDLAAGSPAQACGHVQDFERKVFEKQIKALDKDIQSADADLLRAAAQQIEAALGCAPVTPVL